MNPLNHIWGRRWGNREPYPEGIRSQSNFFNFKPYDCFRHLALIECVGQHFADLPHFDDEISIRQELAARYSEALGDVCQVPGVASGNTHVFTPYTVRLDHRDRICALLRERGIPVAIYYPRCLHEQPAYAAYATSENFPEGELASREVLSLPLYPFLTESEQDCVISGLRDVIAEVNSNCGSNVD